MSSYIRASMLAFSLCMTLPANALQIDAQRINQSPSLKKQLEIPDGTEHIALNGIINYKPSDPAAQLSLRNHRILLHNALTELYPNKTTRSESDTALRSILDEVLDEADHIVHTRYFRKKTAHEDITQTFQHTRSRIKDALSDEMHENTRSKALNFVKALEAQTKHRSLTEVAAMTNRLWIGGLSVTALTAVAGGTYWWFNRKEEEEEEAAPNPESTPDPIITEPKPQKTDEWNLHTHAQAFGRGIDMTMDAEEAQKTGYEKLVALAGADAATCNALKRMANPQDTTPLTDQEKAVIAAFCKTAPALQETILPRGEIGSLALTKGREWLKKQAENDAQREAVDALTNTAFKNLTDEQRHALATLNRVPAVEALNLATHRFDEVIRRKGIEAVTTTTSDQTVQTALKKVFAAAKEGKEPVLSKKEKTALIAVTGRSFMDWVNAIQEDPRGTVKDAVSIFASRSIDTVAAQMFGDEAAPTKWIQKNHKALALGGAAAATTAAPVLMNGALMAASALPGLTGATLPYSYTLYKLSKTNAAQNFLDRFQDSKGVVPFARTEATNLYGQLTTTNAQKAVTGTVSWYKKDQLGNLVRIIAPAALWWWGGYWYAGIAFAATDVVTEKYREYVPVTNLPEEPEEEDAEPRPTPTITDLGSAQWTVGEKWGDGNNPGASVVRGAKNALAWFNDWVEYHNG